VHFFLNACQFPWGIRDVGSGFEKMWMCGHSLVPKAKRGMRYREPEEDFAVAVAEDRSFNSAAREGKGDVNLAGRILDQSSAFVEPSKA
jgi:hypothetical protein